jgi:septum formation protein
MLRAAGLDFEIYPVRIDEDGLRQSLAQEGASPRDIADALAEMKARRCSHHHPRQMVLGCDQVLDFQGKAWGKAATRQEAAEQLEKLRGQTHTLWSAATIYENSAPVWRHIGECRMTMREFSDSFLQDYLDRNWPALSSTVGCYKIEEQGIRLFSAISGDYFSILGLPLVPILGYLSDRGIINA